MCYLLASNNDLDPLGVIAMRINSNSPATVHQFNDSTNQESIINANNVLELQLIVLCHVHMLQDLCQIVFVILIIMILNQQFANNVTQNAKLVLVELQFVIYVQIQTETLEQIVIVKLGSLKRE